MPTLPWHMLEPDTKLGWALRWARTGFPILPLTTQNKPLTQHGKNDATLDESQIRKWWDRWPDANIGGRMDGRLGVDVDPKNDGVWDGLPESNRVHLSGRGDGGGHLIFRLTDEQVSRIGELKQDEWRTGVDLRVHDKGYLALPGSTHHTNNKIYTVKSEGRTDTVLPEKWFDQILVEVGGSRSRTNGARKGRHPTWLSRVHAAVGAGRDDQLPAMRDEFVREVSDRSSAQEAEAEFDRMVRGSRDMRATGELVPRELTDSALAEWVATLSQQRLRWTPETDWLYYEEGTLSRASRETVIESIRLRFREFHQHELGRGADKDRLKQLAGLHTTAKVRAVETLLRGIQEVRAADFDQGGRLLCTYEGVLDFETGELRPHSPDYLMTKRSPVRYDEKATAPRWNEFIDWMTSGDQELARYLQMAAGVSLTGIRLEEIFFLYGPTSGNGKGTFTTALEYIGGDYVHSAQSSLLESQQRTGHQEDLARTHGARAIIVPETRDGKRWDTVLIKQIIGGDVLTVSEKGKPQFSFRPVAKVWVSGNHKPNLGDADPAVFRRLRVIPCRATLDPEKMDYEYKDRMAHAEGPGILNWALAGYRAWAQEGQGRLAVPAAVRRASAKYRQEEDRWSDVMSQLVFEDGTWLSAAELTRVCLNDEPDPGGHRLTALYRELSRRGDMADVDVRKQRTRRGSGVAGVRLRTTTERREQVSLLPGVIEQ